MKQICAVLRRVPKTIWLLLGVGALILVPFLFFGGPIEAWFLQMADPAAGTARQVMGWVLFGLLAFDVVLPVPSSLASTLCGVLFGLWGGFWLSFGALWYADSHRVADGSSAGGGFDVVRGNRADAVAPGRAAVGGG